MEKKFESFIGIFKKAMEEHPDKTAVIVDDRRRTYGEIFEHAAKIAGHLSRCNIRKGDPVSTMLTMWRQCLDVLWQGPWL